MKYINNLTIQYWEFYCNWKKYLSGSFFPYFWLLVCAHTDNSDLRTINQGEIRKFIMFFLCFSRIPNWFLHLEIWTSLSVSIWITRTDMCKSIGIRNIVWWLSHQWEEWWGTYPTNDGLTLWSISLLHDFKMNDIRYEGIE